MVDVQYLSLDDVHFRVARTEGQTEIDLMTGDESYLRVFFAQTFFEDRACSAIAQAYVIGHQHGEVSGMLKCRISIREALGLNDARTLPEAY